MCHIFAVKIDKGLQHLHRIDTHIILSQSVIAIAHLVNAGVHILEVDAEYVVIDDLRVVVLDEVSVLQELVALYFLLDRLYFLLVEAQIRVHQLNHLYRNLFAGVDIQCSIDFTCCSLTEKLAHLPLQDLAICTILSGHLRLCCLNLGSCRRLGSRWEKVVLLLLLGHFRRDEQRSRCIDLSPLTVIHVELLVYHLDVRVSLLLEQLWLILGLDLLWVSASLSSEFTVWRDDLGLICSVNQVLNLRVFLPDRRWHGLVAV